jgi:hypothetical protein
MTVLQPKFRILATVSCVIGASVGAPDGFPTWVLLTLVACSSVVTLWARHADRFGTSRRCAAAD